MKKNSVYSEYLKDRKTIMTMVSMTFAFAIVIILSFGTNFYFRELGSDFFVDIAVSFALCVYCLFFGVPEGKNLYQKKIGGRYYIARQKFLEVRDTTIKKDFEFDQRLDKYYDDKKLEYFKTLLLSRGIRNIQVLDLDFSELDNLYKPYKKNWKNTEFEGRKDTYFRSLTNEQIEFIKKIFTGKINVDKIPNDYFKTLNGKIILSEYIEQSKSTKRDTIQFIVLVLYRIIMVFAFAFIISGFGFEVITSGDTQVIVSRTVSTLSRLWTMITSFVYGFAVGQIQVSKESDKLEFKTRINIAFLNDKNFVALTEEEINKKAYEEYEKRVIEPEIVQEIAQKNDTIMLDYKGK